MRAMEERILSAVGMDRDQEAKVSDDTLLKLAAAAM